VLRWDLVSVDVGGASSITGGARGRRRAGAAPAFLDDPLPRALRVQLTGQTRLHGELFGAAARLRAEVVAQAASIAPERLWIEKLRIETTPLTSAATLADRADAIAELQAALLGAPDDAGLLQAWKTS
jgi:hypothetical protein